ncbi:PGF-CTERM sorting domain-containing protein [Haloplanus halobius]|uniref:PGF-CTERM sorting domain-containing protein n=1 Tax=Haloplanus halobius TaxID=2934938 RepID=UPI00200C4BC9|nr:PGF-CTERM sorting domain-containing protein [Haloplanus sp. XH21]
MSQLPGRYRRAVTAIGFACLGLALISGMTVAVSGLAVTSLTNSEAQAGQTTTHTLEYQANEISADGETDVLFVEFPNAYAGNLSFSSAEFRNRTSDATVPVSSSTSIVDGPDDDGVRDTLRTGVSKDADYPTDDITATYEFSLTHPPVEETTSYDLRLVANDSSTGTSETTATDAITVVAGDDATATATATAEPTATTTATQTETETATASPTATEAMTDTATEAETTSGDGPGFGVIAAAGALLAIGLLARRD